MDFHFTGFVEFFFVDTTPFVNDYFTDPTEHTYDWKGILPQQEYLSNPLRGNLRFFSLVFFFFFFFFFWCGERRRESHKPTSKSMRTHIF